jgi:hypothetical protein
MDLENTWRDMADGVERVIRKEETVDSYPLTVNSQQLTDSSQPPTDNSEPSTDNSQPISN